MTTELAENGGWDAQMLMKGKGRGMELCNWAECATVP